MFKVKVSTLIIHIAGWLLFFSLPFILMPRPQGNENALKMLVSVSYWLIFFFYIFLFYFNAYFLIPTFYLRKKYLIYFAIILVVFVIGYFLRQEIGEPSHANERMRGMPFHDSLSQMGTLPPGPGFNQNMPSPPPGDDGHGGGPPRINFLSIFLFTVIWALSTAIRVTQQWGETEQRAIVAEADKANAELSFLKAQINPHFLFNTLNNIYTLAVKKNENTADCIMKLSNIMRYVTDDVNNDHVSLQDEIDCISDYIDLQKLRLSKKVTVNFTVSGNLDGRRIQPLVLMTFIENVFKYGISNHEPCTITIQLFSEEKTITFFCQNKVFDVLRKEERTGIGIANTRKRLQHLYPGKHLLNITKEDDLYTVQLTIQV